MDQTPSSEAAAAPAPATALRVAAVAVQLGLAALVVRQFQLESRTLLVVLLIALIGFPLHALLPRERRLPAFVLLSLVGFVVILSLPGVLFLLAAGGLLIGLCHLPVPWPVRLGLLVLAGTALALARADVVPSPVSEVLWPVLGSIFMFRLALYAHSVRHGDAPTGLWPTLAYFFMLPNVAFPLFPVVDYTVFTRSHYEGAAVELYERGVSWIVRGLAHLLLYRLVYYYVALDPVSIRTQVELLQYVVSTFLLYLRVSGQFHLIVGLLYLFGFRLSETHHLYYLARSLTDLWRRINIYWTDFMMKLVYYPAYFRLRRLGNLRAILLSTATVFFVTWLLHAYQWFWLLGKLQFTVTDTLFWGILGVAVLLTTAVDLGRPRKRPPTGWNLRQALGALATFLGMSLLWSLWSSPTLEEWTALFVVPLVPPTLPELGVVVLLMAGFLVVAGLPWAGRRLGDTVIGGRPLAAELGRAGARCLLLGGLLLTTLPVAGSLPAPILEVTRSLGETGLNARDEAIEQRGYYEELNQARQPTGRSWTGQVVAARRPNSVLEAEGVLRNRDDLLRRELRPGASLDVLGHSFSTNQWGMRDRDYTLAKPPGAWRAAVLGPSFVMGLGVSDGEAFDNVLEARLNADSAPRLHEVLNFGVSDQSLLNMTAMLEQRALRFQPDVVLLVVDPRVRFRVMRAIAHSLPGGQLKGDAELLAVVAETGVKPGMGRTTVMRRLQARGDAIMLTIFRRAARLSREQGAVPVLVVTRLPTSRHRVHPADFALAREAGLEVIDLVDAYAGHDERQLVQSDSDKHQNAEGHRVLGERLYRALLALGGSVGLAREGTADPTTHADGSTP